MKKALKLKAFMLSMVMGFALLPMNMFAQSSDDFFCVDDAFNGNRDVVAWNITNNGIGQSEAPVGSGLLVLGAIGAGYAIAKRKRNKKGAALLLALALTLGFTQCKKKVVEPIANNGNTVHITLTMAGGGSRVIVDPTNGGANNYASVSFESGDKIYVGNGGKYVGYVTYNGTNTWEGDLTSPSEGDYLHLYFLGNKAPLSDVTPGTTTEFSVSIADQASKYPVISYNHTLEKYNGEGSYTATTLYNKCSIMKFNVATGTNYANDPIRITGMHNKVTVDFAKPNASENGFSYSVNTTDGGLIKMPAKDASNVTWAIVLPQDALAEGTAGSAYTNGYKGNRPAISKIERNHYYAGDGIAMTINTESNIINLSTVYENWTAENGWTLTGTLSGNYKITIADGATVTLDNISINYPSGSNYESGFAGITCLGDATIILKNGTTNNVAAMDYRYPGIQVGPSGKTLTIQGTGALNAKYRKQGTNDISYGCGIGGGGDISCGNIVINDGTINAEAFNKAAGIGSGCCRTTSVSCGTITINGGAVTATGGAYAAGIGTGYAEGGDNSCGAISINGGVITATGGQYGAGIGTGYSVSYRTNTCASITITDGVTQVTATKGTGAPNSIGAGDYGTCGTVTIGGNEGAISTSPYTYIPAPAPAAPTGAIDGLFSVSSTKQVYFSQGNLQAVGTTSSSPSSGWTWQFAEHQWDYIGGLSSSSGSEAQTGNNYINGNGTLSADGTVDLFCWSTNATYYGIHNSDNASTYSGDFYDWGNAIGSGWRTLTPAEWGYLINTRTTTSDVRFAKAKVNNVNGLILLPDDWSTSYYALSSTNTVNAGFTANEIDASTWASSLEAHGAVFLPAAGNRYIDGGNNNYVSATELAGFYWSSVPYADEWNDKAYNFFFNPGVVDPSYSTKNGGCSVRLVKDAN